MQRSAGSNAYFELVCFNDFTCNYLTLYMYMYIELFIDLRKRFN